MLNILKKFFNNEEVTVVKRGRGRYINFHSYKIFESGRIENSDGENVTPLNIDGKAYLTLKLGYRTKGEVKIEIARIVYSYFVKPIDVVDTKPVIIYKDGNGMNFRLDNIEALEENYEQDVNSVVDNIDEDNSDDVQNIVNENNTGSISEEDIIPEESESDSTEKTVVLEEDVKDSDIEDKETTPEEEDEVLDELLNNVCDILSTDELLENGMNIDGCDKEIEQTANDEELINTVTEILEESEEEVMEQNENIVQPEEVTEEVVNEVNDVIEEIVENNVEKTERYTMEEINEINKNATRLVAEDFVKELKEKEAFLIQKYSEAIYTRDEKINVLETELNALKAEKERLTNECYFIRKDAMQRMYGVFDKLVQMVEELRK